MSRYLLPEGSRSNNELPRYMRGELDNQLYTLVDIRITLRTAPSQTRQTRSPHWTDAANCVGLSTVEEILPMCGSCPVRQHCLNEGLRLKETGPYGGLTLKNGEIVYTPVW